MINELVLLVVITLVTVFCVSSGCPAPELIKPCVCKDNGIICGGHSEIDIGYIFYNLRNNLTKSEKHFKSFHLNNTFITELKENTFKDITFDEITIENCTNLTKISSNAFTETDLVTKILNIHSNPKLSSTDNSIFQLLSKFVNLEKLYLVDNNITEIPSNAFQSIVGYQDKLINLTIGGKSIKKIGDRPFYVLNGLNRIKLSNTSIKSIPEYAFEFEQESKIKLTLILEDNYYLNSVVFPQYSLSRFKRPVDLDLGFAWNHFEYLDEKLFENFLKSNAQNQIEMNNVNFDCDNCMNFWLTKQPTLLTRFRNLSCSNKKKFNDTENFGECPYNQLLKPCIFSKKERAIYCGGNYSIDLKAIFHNFSKQLSKNEKHFKTFKLFNNYIKVLEENTFDEITFDQIVITGCDNLTNIKKFAFNTTDKVTKTLDIQNSFKLGKDEPLFETLSSFVNIERIGLYYVGLNEIPSKAFQTINGKQIKLKHLAIEDEFTKIGSLAFSSLKNLTQLLLFSKKVNSISDNAFEFEEHSEQLIDIEFYGFNVSAFKQNTLLNIGRPTNIELSYVSNANYLDEKDFIHFLMDNNKNTLKLRGVQVFDCNDCRNYWIKKNQNLTKRVTANCSNKKLLNDPDNFKNCTSFMYQ